MRQALVGIGSLVVSLANRRSTPGCVWPEPPEAATTLCRSLISYNHVAHAKILSCEVPIGG
jgi:hypothetical protein